MPASIVVSGFVTSLEVIELNEVEESVSSGIIDVDCAGLVVDVVESFVTVVTVVTTGELTPNATVVNSSVVIVSVLVLED